MYPVTPLYRHLYFVRAVVRRLVSQPPSRVMRTTGYGSPPHRGARLCLTTTTNSRHRLTAKVV